MNNKNIIEKIESFQNILISCATGGEHHDDIYKELRREIISVEKIKNDIPDFIILSRDLNQFWDYIQPKFNTYKERRQFIRNSLGKILDNLESQKAYPSDKNTTCVIKALDLEYIQNEWNKALDRRGADPEAAITSARSLLESVCKYILEKNNVTYDEKSDLPKLYNLAAKSLNLSPSQHTEGIFKEILNGCFSVVSGLGALRNKLGDAHGKNIKYIKPSQRHAQLAVNLAGATATFLLETIEKNISNED